MIRIRKPWVVGGIAGAVVLLVASGVWWWARTTPLLGWHAFVLTNESGAELRDVRLHACGDGPTPPRRLLARVDCLEPGETFRVRFRDMPWFFLGVEFTGPAGRTIVEQVKYIDADEVRFWRTVDLVIDADLDVYEVFRRR